MLLGAGLDQVWHHSRAHGLFTNARWSGDALGLALADLVVARLLPAGAALTVAVDDTLFKRSGKKVFGAAWHHDGAAKGPETYRVRQLLGRGRHRGAATVSVPPGVSAGAGAAVAAAAHREDRARPRLAELIAARYPDRTVHVVGDAAYVGERLRDVDTGSPGPAASKTSVLHELPPPRTGRSGRPRTRGPRLGTMRPEASLAAAAGRRRRRDIQMIVRSAILGAVPSTGDDQRMVCHSGVAFA